MSDDEAQGDQKTDEDAYAAELADEDDDYDGTVAKKAKVAAKPAWCLVVTLTFDEVEKVKKLKELFDPYAEWIKANEPGTLSYSLILSDKNPLQVTVFERYGDRLEHYLVKHK